MPGISDPGHDLIVAAIERGIPVVPIPGPSVLLTALIISGLPSHQFLFLGFFPRRKGERRRLLESVAAEPRTLVAFESPHRLLTTLEDLAELLGNRRIALCRELTKVHEEVFRGTVSAAIEHFQEPRGEFTVVVEGIGKVERDSSSEEMEEHLLRLKKGGIPAKEAVAEVAKASGMSKKEVYRAWLRLN
jgi:16S rRNA (cytidine1402-2'-O)-methyltransferase